MAEKYTAQVHPLQARRTPVPELDIRRGAMSKAGYSTVHWALQDRRTVAAFTYRYGFKKMYWMRRRNVAYMRWIEGTAP